MEKAGECAAGLADLARADAAFMQVAAVYAGHADFDAARLVAELVAAEAVPLLPVQRYTEDGLRKRAQWQDTWALQRREDAGVAPPIVGKKEKDIRTGVLALLRSRRAAAREQLSAADDQ